MKGRLTLRNCREAFDTYSEKTSEIARSVTLAGIAVIWVLRETEKANPAAPIPHALFWPICLFVLSAFFDLLHYLVSAISWHNFFREKEKQGVSEDDSFDAQPSINAPGWFCFSAKIGLLGAGYVLLLKYLYLNFVS